MLEFNAWVVRAHALRKVFVSVKGIYFQVRRPHGPPSMGQGRLVRCALELAWRGETFGAWAGMVRQGPGGRDSDPTALPRCLAGWRLGTGGAGAGASVLSWVSQALGLAGRRF